MGEFPDVNRGEAMRLPAALAGLVSLGAGVYLAHHHPLWPSALTAAFALWTVVAARWPGLWLFVLPAALPILNFSPWTGWLIFDEFDLLVLGALAGEFARLSLVSAEVRPDMSRTRESWGARAGAGAGLAFAALGLLTLARGLADADFRSIGWFDGYADAANSVRVSKSLLFASAFWPLMRTELRQSPARTIQRLARGMEVGLAVVGLAVLWERSAYPGLLDFSARYRTTGTFWEMHVGGAAIDAYLALATPFAAWALWSARSRRDWAAAAVMALLTAHAGLTTFSRGAYVGVTVPLALLGCAWWGRRLRAQPRAATVAAAWAVFLASAAAALLIATFATMGYGGAALALLSLLGLIVAIQRRVRSLHWRYAAGMALTLALMTEAVAVIGGGSFMRSRLDASDSDLAARLAHWRHGIELLSGPAEWLIGIGSGRLPARYSRQVPHGEFSGALSLVASSSDSVARLSGPPTEASYAGLFSLTQHVSLTGAGTYSAGLRVRVKQPTEIAIDLCEQHLLYPRGCQGTIFRVVPREGWEWVNASLEGPVLSRGSWYAPRLGVFSVSLRDVGTSVDIAEASLRAPDDAELLLNRDFAMGLAHWFPSAEANFLPWHIDNLYLESLIERGVLGLATFLLMLAFTFRKLLSLPNGESGVAPFLAASLLGPLLVGAVSSVFDVPRIAFLFLWLVVFALQLRTPATRPSVAFPRDQGGSA